MTVKVYMSPSLSNTDIILIPSLAIPRLLGATKAIIHNSEQTILSHHPHCNQAQRYLSVSQHLHCYPHASTMSWVTSAAVELVRHRLYPDRDMQMAIVPVTGPG